MIDIMEDNMRGIVHYTITEEADVDGLPRKGIRTGSSATLYLIDGSIQIWNFVAAKESSSLGTWILMK